MSRNVTTPSAAVSTDYPTLGLEWEDHTGRDDPEQRYALYRLCVCSQCRGEGTQHTGPVTLKHPMGKPERCSQCRGEGRTLELLATCGTEAAVGITLVTLAREGEWADDCPLGLLDRMGEPHKRWLILPWRHSPRNVSDAGRTLRNSRQT